MSHEPARVAHSADQGPARDDPRLRLVEASRRPGDRFVDQLVEMPLEGLLVGHGLGLLAAVCVIATALV